MDGKESDEEMSDPIRDECICGTVYIVSDADRYSLCPRCQCAEMLEEIEGLESSIDFARKEMRIAREERDKLRATDEGIFATHDFPCCVRGCGAKAVLDMNEGIFQPCWEHQRTLGCLKTRKRPWWKFGSIKKAKGE